MRKVPRVAFYWLEHAQNPQCHLKKRAFQHQTCLSPTVYNIFTLIYGLQGWYPHLHLEPKGHFTHETESPWPLHFKHSHWWKRRGRSKFTSHYAWGTNGVCGCKMDIQSTWIHSYMASGFMVTRMIFKNHLLEVGLAKNWETMELRMLTTVNVFYFIMCEDPHV